MFSVAKKLFRHAEAISVMLIAFPVFCPPFFLKFHFLALLVFSNAFDRFVLHLEARSIEHLQGIFKVRGQIIGVLNTHRHANHAGGNAHLPAGLIGHAHVRGGDGVTQRGVEAAQRRSVLGELQRQHKLVDFLQILRQLCFRLPQP